MLRTTSCATYWGPFPRKNSRNRSVPKVPRKSREGGSLVDEEKDGKGK